MKFFPFVFPVVFLLAGCGGGSGDAQPTNSAFKNQFSAQAANINQTPIKPTGRLGTSNAPEKPLGVDDDNNGVWDDVDHYITMRIKDPEKAKAMRQLALAIQNALINNDTKEKGQESTRIWFRALDCLDKKLGKAWLYESKRLTAEMLNSEARSRAYVLLNSNSVGFYSQEKGEVCDQ